MLKLCPTACGRRAPEASGGDASRALGASVFRNPGDPPYLNPLRLARYVLDRRLGYSPSYLNRDNVEGSLRMMAEGGIEVCRAPGQLNACEALVEGFLPDDGRAVALVAEARALASEVPGVREAVEDALRMGRLEGRCQYLRSRGLRSRARSWWRRVWGRGAVRTTIEGHVLGQAELMGRYKRR